jgi:hypothetical protein
VLIVGVLVAMRPVRAVVPSVALRGHLVAAHND